MMADDMMDDSEDFFGEEISWEDAAEDLEKQKELINSEASTGGAAPQAESTPAPAATATQAVEISPELGELDPGRLNVLLDIPLQVTVELGRSKMLINDLLQLGQGSVIELSKLIGEPLDILINDNIIAKGEVVVVNEKFGVRLTEVSSKKTRIENMGG